MEELCSRFSHADVPTPEYSGALHDRALSLCCVKLLKSGGCLFLEHNLACANRYLGETFIKHLLLLALHEASG